MMNIILFLCLLSIFYTTAAETSAKKSYHSEDLLKRYPDKYDCKYCYDTTKLEMKPHNVDELKLTVNLNADSIYDKLKDLKN